MCNRTYRDALAAISIREHARRLMAACDAIKLEAAGIVNYRQVDLAALAEAIARAQTSIAVLTPVIGGGLIELAQVEQLAALQAEIHMPEAA